jgi:hypothetical protein
MVRSGGIQGTTTWLAPSTIHQYFMGLERELFRKCFRKKPFPLRVSVLFATPAANNRYDIRAFRFQTLRRTVTVFGANMGMSLFVTQILP